jgi:enamine deaminase RidA (YjgF/YER057c/UK114 family)
MRLDEGQLAVLDGAVPPSGDHPLVAATVRAADGLWVSGQVPFGADGTLLARGVVGRDVSTEVARRCARQCAVNVLARAREELGALSAIRRVTRVTVYVASTDDFTDHPEVAHGASELFVELLGAAGRHARAAIGVASLPLGAPVEVEALLDVGPVR